MNKQTSPKNQIEGSKIEKNMAVKFQAGLSGQGGGG
jgi:hypothetical protein